MLIDSFAPNPDAVEMHSVSVTASRDIVYQTLLSASLGGSLIIKALMGVRSLPEIVLHPRRSWKRGRKITLQTLMDAGFGLLAEEPGQEIVLGVTGRFWRPTGNLSPFNRADFDRPVPAGLARGVWNFSLKEEGPGRTILSTETRVVCGDDASRRKFRIYWLLVRPFSGLIRRVMLRAVKRACCKTYGAVARP
ncbi:MAG TPA: hypothetical protein VK582_15230 [Pyrinomonadaceae bacterium]|nr:hypothetical protein [Pyrinomonadaceae bacterium]